MKDERLGVLDGLRATSLLLVLAAHMLPLGPKVLRLNSEAGLAGMSLFFTLSGFLITRGLLLNPGVGEFLVRRLARILPLAYLYLALVFVFVGLTPQAALVLLGFVGNYHPELMNEWTLHFWSLCVEIQFYGAMALACLLLGRRGPWLVVPACLLITAARIATGTGYAMETHLRVDEILAGASVALLLHRGLVAPFKGRAAFWIALTAWLACSSPHAAFLQYLRPYAAAGLLLASIGLGEGAVRSLLVSRPARYVAELSYALYVFHPATYQGWMNDGPQWSKYLLKRPVSFALTFALAHLSTRYWEKAWIRLGKRITAAMRSRTANGRSAPGFAI